MDAAAEWHTQPWKLAGGTSKTLWYARYEAVRDSRRKQQDKLRREIEALRNR